jgi:hypothetical protein
VDAIEVAERDRRRGQRSEQRAVALEDLHAGNVWSRAQKRKQRGSLLLGVELGEGGSGVRLVGID